MELNFMSLTVTTFLSPRYENLYRYVAQAIADRLGTPLDFRVGNEFSEFLAGESDLAFACGFWYVQNTADYDLVAAPVMAAQRYNAQPVYCMEIISAAHFPARNIEELAGKVFGYNEEESWSGYWAFRSEIERAGLHLHSYFRPVKTGSHVHSLAALLDGKIDFASIDSTVLEHELAKRPELEQELHRIKTLGPHPAPPLMAQRRLSETVRREISQAIRDLPQKELAKFGAREYRAVTPDFYADMSKIAAIKVLAGRNR
jgi:phosphonate transport system substrate-binding protein